MEILLNFVAGFVGGCIGGIVAAYAVTKLYSAKIENDNKTFLIEVQKIVIDTLKNAHRK